MQLRLLRDSTVIGTFATEAGHSDGHLSQNGIGTGGATSYLDSPNTTSATTYKVQWRNSSGTSYLGQFDGNATEYNSSSTITVMEVAA